MTTRLWILGAADPEMAAIEQLLTECGERFAFAVGADGQHVIPRTAYEAVGAVTPDGSPVDPASITHVVECSIDGADHATVIDHHRPGDPGYGRPPEEFLAASSIGQVIRLLGWEKVRCGNIGREEEWEWVSSRSVVRGGVSRGEPLPAAADEIELVAAADHCLAAAYRGECPGVHPDDLMRWRVKSRASHQGRTEEQLLADIQRARKILRDAVAAPPAWAVDPDPSSDWPGIHPDDVGPRPYADLRRLRTAHVPELPEAACREGIPYIATVRERDDREKVVLGAAPPELVERFLRGELVPGLVERYGDPARGFAGGYPAKGA